MADLDVTKKLDVYHALYRLNLSLTNIVRRCQDLQQARVFRPKYLRLFQGFTQELQAEINSELLETLSERELDDWSRFGKVRQAWEKYLKDPDDVFIEAKERREQLRRQKTKPHVGGKNGVRRGKPAADQHR
jgi:hypothetical protein